MIDYGRLFRLDGKVALISGGARGLGAEQAHAQFGAHVVVSDVLDQACEETAASIRNAGGKASAVHHDVTSESQWEQVVDAVIRDHGGFDVLINNAGIEQLELVAEHRSDDFRRMLDVNVMGVFLGLKYGVKAMMPGGRAGKGGSIINTSSIAGLIGCAALSGYGATKGAVRLMTKAAAVECAQLKTGIRVNSVHPGLISTQMANSFFTRYTRIGLAPSYEAGEEAFKAMTPMGSLGTPGDVAAGVLFLASDASKWMTGAELVIDGGYTAG